jgi:site-specific DNA-methyltransferase (adenine-specific)
LHLLINTDYKNVIIQNVNHVISDPPYNSTQNSWDAEEVDSFFYLPAEGYLIFTCDFKFGSKLLQQKPDLFSHDLVWVKTVGSGQLNINNRPLRLHENILIFKVGKPQYNRLKHGEQNVIYSRDIKTLDCYGQQKQTTVSSVGKDSKTVLEVGNKRFKGGHPTQKPIELFQKLVDMYTQPEDIVIDLFSGSSPLIGTSAISINIEKECKYYEYSRNTYLNKIIEDRGKQTDFFQNYIPNLSDFEFTVFN